MDNDIYVAPSEKLEAPEPEPVPEAPAPVAATEQANKPASIEDVIAGLRGFGIEDNEEILTFSSKDGKKVRVRITNIPTDEELSSLIAADGFKGYAWMQRIRIEILSRSISWIDGIDIRALREQKAVIKDADGVYRDIQTVLRNTLLGWGQELIMVLWKIAMVHSDKIEKRYQSDFPDSTLMTDVERRFTETILKEIEDSSKEVISDVIKQVFDEEKDE